METVFTRIQCRSALNPRGLRSKLLQWGERRQGETTGASSEPPTRPRGPRTSPSPGRRSPPHSPSAARGSFRPQAGRFPRHEDSALYPPAPRRGSSRTQARPWQGMPGVAVFPALRGPPPRAGSRPEPSGAHGTHGTHGPVTRMTTGSIVLASRARRDA